MRGERGAARHSRRGGAGLRRLAVTGAQRARAIGSECETTRIVCSGSASRPRRAHGARRSRRGSAPHHPGRRSPDSPGPGPVGLEGASLRTAGGSLSRDRRISGDLTPRQPSSAVVRGTLELARHAEVDPLAAGRSPRRPRLLVTESVSPPGRSLSPFATSSMLKTLSCRCARGSPAPPQKSRER